MRLAASAALALLVIVLEVDAAIAETSLPTVSALPWWAWVLLLFAVTFVLGIVAIVGGVGGGVLFVPIVSSLFPFHLDFVRGTGLLIALAGALAAGPNLLRGGVANLKLALPAALIASASAIVGANIGLILPDDIVHVALGTMILGIVGVLLAARKSNFPEVPRSDALGEALHMHGIYHDPLGGGDFKWQVHHTWQGMLLFVGVGIMAGMFGIGAGWANVPILNLVLGAPLKVSIGTSSLLLSIVDSAAAWIYLHHGAMLAIIAVPSMLGMILGSTIGVGFLTRANASILRKIVIVLLLLAGCRTLLKGLGL